MTTIGIIGYGNMGQAIYHVLEKAFGSDKLYVVDPHAEKLSHLPKGHGSADVAAVLDKIDIVILAVKPQSFVQLATSLQMRLKGKKIFSILAGVSLASLQSNTGATDVVRAMPNLPLKVGLALTAWIPSQSGAWALPILNALGDDLRVSNEDLLDAVGALSGCGPAYFFYLCELLARKAEALGFDSEQAQKIAEATFVGSAELLSYDIKSASEWRQAVTSKGGMTAAALEHLQKQGFEKTFDEAVDQSLQRAKALS